MRVINDVTIKLSSILVLHTSAYFCIFTAPGTMSLFKFFQSRKTKTDASTTAATPAPTAPSPENPPTATKAPSLASVPAGLPTFNIPNIPIVPAHGQPTVRWGPVAQPVVSLPSKNPLNLFEQAQTLHKEGRLQQAKERYEQLLKAEPQHTQALHYLGLLHVQLGQRDQGIALIRQSLSLDPDQFAAWANLAPVLKEAGRMEEAEACFNAALALKKDAPELWNNLGNMQLLQNKWPEAITSYQQALALNPRMATAANQLAVACILSGQFSAALQAADQALAVDPEMADAHDTRGSALRRLGRLDEALASCDKALSLKPQHISYTDSRCSVLEDMERYEEAIPGLQHIRSQEPDYQSIAARLLYAQRRCLIWSDIQALTQQVVDSTLAGRLSSEPFNMLTFSDRADVQLACARQSIASIHPRQRQALPNRARQPGERIRVAYVSADLREHAVAYLMAGVFEQHDRSQFDITAIALKPAENSPMGLRVKAAFDHFLDVSDWSDARIIDHMRQQGYDIAVDLMGLTFGARPGIWAQGIAPAQVSYLGYPGTTGAAYMDYILADDMVIPPEQQPYYSEKVVYLPDCFQANDRKRVIADQSPSRAELGLPAHAFVFCCFNNLYKIGPETFDGWARILMQVPDSVLWLVENQEAVRQRAQQEAQARGIAPERLFFAPRATYPAHLARMRQADLFLDTLPFNAGTTASDALWAGLPVLTCPGRAFAARMAASLLRAAGIPELIAPDQTRYEALAVDLAHHPDQLRSLRQRVADQRLQCPLFDTLQFTRNLETAYQNML